MKQKRKNKIIILSLLGILCIMTVGYAAFQNNLIVKGISNISSNWNVEITSVTESNKAGQAETVGTPTYTNTTAYIEANLYEKGDFVEYDVTVKNSGTIDAALEDITDDINTNNEAVKISFSGYIKGQKLFKNTSEVIKVRIEYNPDFNGIQTEGSSEANITLNYVQAEGGTIPSTEKYLITYDCTANGGADCSSFNEYKYTDDSIDLSHTSTKEGYKFAGWSTSPNVTNASQILTSLDLGEENITLYAVYKKEKNITYTTDTNISSIGQSNDKCIMYNNSTTCEITLPPITAANGYTILGWYNGNTKVGDVGSKININQNITLTAKAVDDIKPTVSLNPNTQTTYVTSKAVTVTLEDLGSGIAANQQIYYAWSTSNTTVPTYSSYVTTTNTSGETSTTVTVPTTSNSSLTGTYYLWIKEGTLADTAGNTSLVKTSAAFKFDNTNPSLSVATSKTTKSITVVATASAESEITKYEFSSNGGSTWVDNGTNKTYTFSNLENTTSYQIQVRVTSGVGKTTTSTSTSVQPNSISVPTYKESVTFPKTVTITYPSGCGSTYTCTYKKDSGTAVNVTSTTVNVSFTASGTLSATVSDGKNTVSSSYTVTVPKTVYAYHTDAKTIGSSKLTTSDFKTNYTELNSYKSGKPVFLKYDIDSSGLIQNAYVCMKFSFISNPVCLQGGSANYYNSNKGILEGLKSTFSSNGGTCSSNYGGINSYCYYDQLNIFAYSDGKITAYDVSTSSNCDVNTNSSAYCR